VGALALTFPLLLGDDGWLLGEGLAEWRIGGWVGCCCKRGENHGGTFVSHIALSLSFFLKIFKQKTQKTKFFFPVFLLGGGGGWV